MKSSAFLCLLFFLCSQIMFAQVESNFFPEGNARANIKSMKDDFKAKKKERNALFRCSGTVA